MGISFVQVGRGCALGVEGVGGDDHVVEVCDAVEQGGEVGDLVGFVRHRNLSEDGACAMVNGCHQMHPVPAVVLRAVDFLAIERDGCCIDGCLDPGSRALDMVLSKA